MWAELVLSSRELTVENVMGCHFYDYVTLCKILSCSNISAKDSLSQRALKKRAATWESMWQISESGF